MKRLMSRGLLLVGAVVCLGIAIGIIYFAVLPSLQTVRDVADNSIPWKDIGGPLLMALAWSGGGLIASYLFFDTLHTFTGHPKSEDKPWLGYRKWSSPSQSFGSQGSAAQALNTIIDWTGYPREKKKKGRNRS